MAFAFHFVLNIVRPGQDDSCPVQQVKRDLKFERDMITLQYFYLLFKHLASLKEEQIGEHKTLLENDACDMNAIWFLIGSPDCDYYELRAQVIEQLGRFKGFYEQMKTDLIPQLFLTCESAFPCAVTCAFCPVSLWPTHYHETEPNHVKVKNFHVCMMCYEKYREKTSPVIINLKPSLKPSPRCDRSTLYPSILLVIFEFAVIASVITLSFYCTKSVSISLISLIIFWTLGLPNPLTTSHIPFIGKNPKF